MALHAIDRAQPDIFGGDDAFAQRLAHIGIEKIGERNLELILVDQLIEQLVGIAGEVERHEFVGALAPYGELRAVIPDGGGTARIVERIGLKVVGPLEHHLDLASRFDLDPRLLHHVEERARAEREGRLLGQVIRHALENLHRLFVAAAGLASCARPPRRPGREKRSVQTISIDRNMLSAWAIAISSLVICY